MMDLWAPIFGFSFLVLINFCSCAEGNTYNFRCYTASKPCTRGTQMARLKECIKYRGRCVERIWPENVKQCCKGYVGKHCDNYINDEFYFASAVTGYADVAHNNQRTQEYAINRRGLTGQKGNRGPEGFIGQPGEKGQSGWTGRKGQKGESGQSESTLTSNCHQCKNGEMGRRGKRGPRGRKGRKGNTGPMGPSGLQGIPGVHGTRVYTDCNCSDLAVRIERLETLVKTFMEKGGGPFGKPEVQLTERPLYASGRIQPSSTDSTPSVMDTTHSPEMATTTSGEEPRPEVTRRPPETTSLPTETLTTTPQPTGGEIRTRVNTPSTSTTTHPISSCNNSNTVPFNCDTGTLCNMPVPSFLHDPPPLPDGLQHISHYLKTSSCCSSETLEYAFRYYSEQHSLFK